MENKKIEEQSWSKLKISGRIMVSDFSCVHCTDSFEIEHSREEVVPGAVFLTPPNYYSVAVEQLEGEDVVVKVGDSILRLTPGKWGVGPKRPLSYAWSEIAVKIL